MDEHLSHMEEEEREFSLVGPSKRHKSRRPLAERLRPLSLDEVRGQEHVLGEGCLLPSLIRENRVGNLILAGPPGSGKTTLASVIAAEGGCKLVKVNAVTSNVADLRGCVKNGPLPWGGELLSFRG